MKIILVIDDLDNGQVAVNAQSFMNKAEIAAGVSETPASVMGDYLQHACDVYLETRHMDLAQTQQYIQALVKPASTQH